MGDFGEKEKNGLEAAMRRHDIPAPVLISI